MTAADILKALAVFRSACGDDVALRRQVEAMLQLDHDSDDDQVPGSMRAALSDLARTAEADGAVRPTEPLPASIGGYRITRLIAHGGMGDVYEARQQHPARRVAIKVAHASGTTGERARRFELEAQLLARLQHPRIAQIIEAGTTAADAGARPFFVMEFVEGRSLTDHAAAPLPTARQKLRHMLARHLLCPRIPTPQPGPPMTNPNDKTIARLNSFLRGEISAVETYKQALEKTEDGRARAILRENEVSHASRVQLLREEVRRLGGEPSDGSGVWGGFAKAVEGGAKLFGESMAVAALEEGEDHGLKEYRQRDENMAPSVQQTVTSRLLPAQQRTHDAISNLKKIMA